MKSTLFIALALLTACASGPCNNQSRNAESKSAVAAQPKVATQPSASAQSASSTPAPEITKVRVYKPDGSKQCGQGKAIDLKVMEKQLTKAGIKVFSSSKQPDGMMHPQVCGAATGMANTYVISSADLKKAEKLGFSRLET